MRIRLFSTSARRWHENPLGLPRSNAPPQLPRSQRGLPQKRRIRDVGKIVAISSAKGGVGKSTIAVNLAIAFAARGHRTGILDTDIYGPSIPKLFNLSGEPELSVDNRLVPLTNYGVKSMSMGYLVGESSPIVWRGLMVMKAVQQLLHEVEWGGLDVLVLDLPPGTGDVQLTITQQVNLDGAVIVSTPQDIALIDAIRGTNMFRKVGVPVLGLIKNMSYFQCPKCSEKTSIFKAGINRLPEDLEIIGEIPLDPAICSDADEGRPSMTRPQSSQAAAFRQLADRISQKIGLGDRSRTTNDS